MKIERDKAYRTRRGARRMVISTEGKLPGYPIISESDFGDIGLHDADGFITSPRHQDDNDLIAEWIEKPEVDWPKMSAWHRWVAMDLDGQWFAYRIRPDPRVEGGLWYIDSADDFESIPPEYAPKWSGDWRESLCERPE